MLSLRDRAPTLKNLNKSHRIGKGQQLAAQQLGAKRINQHVRIGKKH